MEHFFTPTRRLQDQHDNSFAELVADDYTEGQLAVSIEAFMNHRWDWSAFYAFAMNIEGGMCKLLWITEDTLIWVEGENNELNFDLRGDYAFQQASFTAPSGETHKLILAMDRESSSLSAEAYRIFWHAVTTSDCVKLRLQHWFSCFGLCWGPALLRFLGASPSLELLEFIGLDFEEDHCRALANLERSNLEVTFEGRSFDAQGAKGTFIQWLRRSQVGTKLESCEMDGSIVSALSENSFVKSCQSAHPLADVVTISFGSWPGHSPATTALNIYACH